MTFVPSPRQLPWLNLVFIAFDAWCLRHVTTIPLGAACFGSACLGFQIGMFIWSMAILSNDHAARRESARLQAEYLEFLRKVNGR